ncbi:MAG TPA: hypothetical protein VGR15_01650 [Bacteroidota bacterium]|jgi:hypothetical protein|nr:hypothetical protein [Bacteroidota bacterium]
MRAFIIATSLVMYSVSPLEAQATNGYVSEKVARSFITLLAEGKTTITDLILESEIVASRRLGITYEDVPQKYLIGYNIDSTAKNGIRESNETL